jgi:inosine/xanthosine triphosphate pyrophosphatase family protein
MTKLELEQANTKLAAEVETLRAENSALLVQIAALKEDAAMERDALNHPPAPTKRTFVEEECKVHDYASFKEAKERMVALLAWDTEKRFKFVQNGTRVICKVR